MNPRDVILALGSEPFPLGDELSREYVYSIALKLIDVRENQEIETAAVSYDRARKKFVMHYNPLFFDAMKKKHAWNDEQLKAFIRGVAKHELLHLILKHLAPDSKRPILPLRNLAMDAIINASITEFKHLKDTLKTATPEDLLTNTNLAEVELILPSKEAFLGDWNWEMYYDHLIGIVKERVTPELLELYKRVWKVMKKIKEGSINGRDIEEAESIDEGTLQQIEELMEKAKEAGSLPGKFLQEIEAKLKSSKLARIIEKVTRTIFFGKHVRIQTTYRRPNRRFDDLPGTRRLYVGKRIVVLLDVSGSIDDELLRMFLSQIHTLSRVYGYRVDLFTFDVGISGHIKEDQIRKGHFKIKGRGGTSVKKALEDLRGMNLGRVESLVIITDGFDDPPSQEEVIGRKVVFVFPESHSEDYRKKVETFAKTFVLK
ncbi:VWA-like domain-containing protein [Pseudothermotoga sp.]